MLGACQSVHPRWCRAKMALTGKSSSSNVLHCRALLQYHTSVQFVENYTLVQFDESQASRRLFG